MTQTFDPFDPDAWTDAPGCEAFEQALTMRARSALAPHAVPVLEAHLAACEACRDHAARMAGLDATLATHRGDELAAPGWQRVHDQLHAGIQRYQRRTPWTIALAGAVGVGALAVLGSGPMRVAGLLATFAVYLAIMGFAYWVEQRRQHRLLDDHDVIATYRGELARRLRIARTARWLWPLVAVGEAPRGIGALIETIDGNGDAHGRLATSTLVIALALVAFVMTLVTGRSARRELAGLK